MVFDNRSDKFLKSESLNGKEKRKEEGGEYFFYIRI